MAPTLLTTDGPHQLLLRQGQLKHALKTALACSLATLLTFALRLPNGQFAPLFAFMIMALGMPSPRLNWLQTIFGILIGALGSAVILLALHEAIFLYLAVELLWIFFLLLFSDRFPLAAPLGAMVSALGIFTWYDGTIGDTLLFYFAYWLNWVIGGACVALIDTLVWPHTTRKVFVERLAEVYAVLERHCRDVALQLRSTAPPPTSSEEDVVTDWAPFRRLRQQLAPELGRGRSTSNHFARMILACRSLNLRLWFFNRTIARAAPSLEAAERSQLADIFEECANQLKGLLASAVHATPVSEDNRWRMLDNQLPSSSLASIVVSRIVQDLQTLAACHKSLFASFRAGLAGELVSLQSTGPAGPIFNMQSLRASTKLVLLLSLLLLEEGLFDFPGGAQVAFFATFFASTANLGRQNKTDLVGLFGIFLGFVYGVVAAFLSSRMPYFVLLLALVFFGEFLANLAYQRLPSIAAAGLQAGLAIPFAYLVTPGPEFGSFAAVRTRFLGLAVAGFTAVVVHAYLWPVLPMRQLRQQIAAALRDTAASLRELFGPARFAWSGAPPSLSETVTGARDLLDDARYLPGPDHTDERYHDILQHFQEIDANLEYIHFLIGLEEEHPLRQRFFQLSADYADQASANLEKVARQFEQPGGEPLHWAPFLLTRWEGEPHTTAQPVSGNVDPSRPGVIARCLDQIASAVEKISTVVSEINQHPVR